MENTEGYASVAGPSSRIGDDTDKENRQESDGGQRIDDDNNRKRKRRTVSEESDGGQRPTEDTFVYNGAAVNMDVAGLGGSNATRSLNRGVINALVLLSRCQNKVKNNLFNRLLDDAKYTIMELQNDEYRGLHRKLPDLVRTLLSAIDGTPNAQNPYFLNQMKPVSCVLPKGRAGLERLEYRGMTWATKNGSEYLEVSFFNPFRLVFFGSPQRGGPNSRDYVTQLPFYGDYMDRAVYEMYDYMYDVATRMALKILEDDDKKREGETGSSLERGQAINGLGVIQDKATTRRGQAAEERAAVVKLLRDVTFPLKKKSYDILTTTGNGGAGRDKKAAESMKYLTAVNGEVRLENETSEDALFLSSFIRPRILANGVFSLQIYTRVGLVLHDVNQQVLTIE